MPTVPPPDGSKLIPLTKGQFAIVDSDKYDELMRFKWHIVASKSSGFYAGRSMKKGGKWGYRIFMHKQILGIGKDNIGDHINGNSLDNRTSNLRIATAEQNRHNTRKRRKGRATSKYIGVSYMGYRATIFVNGKRKNLGYFKTEEEAALAYDRACLEARGEFACLNFPSTGTSCGTDSL